MREGQAHPETVPFLLFFCLSSAFGERGCLFLFLFLFVLPLLFSFVSALERRRPYSDWHQSVVEETGYLEEPHHCCLGSGGAAAMALRAACSGKINN